jgi:hypothetical protein
MKVLERAKTPEGIDIQIEDWKEDYSCFNVLSIAAYPIAKNTSKYRWIEGGKRFRLDINKFNNDEEVKQAFNDLANGVKQITDFAEQFYNGDKDKYYMGLIPTFNEF